MKRFAIWGLAFLLFALAALYLASVLWPPPAEQQGQQANYPLLARPGVTHPEQPDPAAATPYDLLPGVARRTDPNAPETGAYSQQLPLLIVDEEGHPLAGASVQLFRAGGNGAVSREGKSDADGKLSFHDLALGTYLVEAEAHGCFPSERQTITLPLAAGATPHIVLARGAIIRAHVEDEAGRPRVDGIVLLQQRDGAQRYSLRVAADGSVESPTLLPGPWEVSWRLHQYADAEPKLSTVVAATAGRPTELWITLPTADAAAPAASGEAHEVGIRLAQ